MIYNNVLYNLGTEESSRYGSIVINITATTLFMHRTYILAFSQSFDSKLVDKE